MPKTNEELYENAERELLGNAIADTEREIADDALGLTPEERNGDRSLEEFDDDLPDDADDDAESDEDEVEAAGEDEGAEGDRRAAPEGQEDRQDRRDDRRGVPSSRLREQSERTRQAEAQAREEREARIRLEERLAALERNGRPNGQQPEGPQKPDMFADPEGYERWLRSDIDRQNNERRVNGSFSEAAEEHGETFQTAFQALRATGDPNLVSSIVGSHNPGRELMRWHDRQGLLRDIGNDPAAYRQRLAQELLSDPEFRKQALTGMRKDAMRGDGDEAGPRTRTRLPPSLSSASGGGSHRGRDPGRSMKSTEEEIASSVWEN